MVYKGIISPFVFVKRGVKINEQVYKELKKRTTSPFHRLIIRLLDKENWTFEKSNFFENGKRSNIYKQTKNLKVSKQTGRHFFITPVDWVFQ